MRALLLIQYLLFEFAISSERRSAAREVARHDVAGGRALDDFLGREDGDEAAGHRPQRRRAMHQLVAAQRTEAEPNRRHQQCRQRRVQEDQDHCPDVKRDYPLLR